MATWLKCPHCNTPMRLIEGNPVYTYWLCKCCWMEFEYNTLSEQFENELKLTKKEREKYASKR